MVNNKNLKIEFDQNLDNAHLSVCFKKILTWVFNCFGLSKLPLMFSEQIVMTKSTPTIYN